MTQDEHQKRIEMMDKRVQTLENNQAQSTRDTKELIGTLKEQTQINKELTTKLTEYIVKHDHLQDSNKRLWSKFEESNQKIWASINENDKRISAITTQIAVSEKVIEGFTDIKKTATRVIITSMLTPLLTFGGVAAYLLSK